MRGQRRDEPQPVALAGKFQRLRRLDLPPEEQSGEMRVQGGPGAHLHRVRAAGREAQTIEEQDRRDSQKR
jgi:hypothetical protein